MGGLSYLSGRTLISLVSFHDTLEDLFSKTTLLDCKCGADDENYLVNTVLGTESLTCEMTDAKWIELYSKFKEEHSNSEDPVIKNILITEERELEFIKRKQELKENESSDSDWDRVD